MKGYELMFFCLKKTISNICINIPFKFYYVIRERLIVYLYHLEIYKVKLVL